MTNFRMMSKYEMNLDCLVEPEIKMYRKKIRKHTQPPEISMANYDININIHHSTKVLIMGNYDPLC